MTNMQIGMTVFAGIMVVIMLRVPIGVAMGLGAIVGITAITNFKVTLGIVQAVPFELVGDWNLTAVPMFLLMGYLAAAAGLTHGLFVSMRMFMSRIPGGLALATLMASAVFCSASGSSTATAAAFARVAVPEMMKARYATSFATGAVAAAGTLGSLIPPSLLMIVYGIMMDTSIAALFKAGILPGLLTVFMYGLYIMLRAWLQPEIAPRTTVELTAEEKREAVRDIWPLPLLIVGVLGGIFTGVFTATEAGAVGAAMAFLIALLRGKLSMKVVGKALKDCGEATAAIFIIVVGAMLMQRFLALSGMPHLIATWVEGNFHSQLGVILAICVIYIIGGTVMESISLMMLTLPLFLPVLIAMDINLVWFGIIIIKLLEIAVLSPPVGMNVNVVKSALGPSVSLTTVFKGVMGYMAVDLVTLGLLIAFPIISLALL